MGGPSALFGPDYGWLQVHPGRQGRVLSAHQSSYFLSSANGVWGGSVPIVWLLSWPSGNGRDGLCSHLVSRLASVGMGASPIRQLRLNVMRRSSLHPSSYCLVLQEKMLIKSVSSDLSGIAARRKEREDYLTTINVPQVANRFSGIVSLIVSDTTACVHRALTCTSLTNTENVH
ncbi:hypothetical protein AVEN_126560-1 [Araneus ventricosus]|uniref:Uncharacterized protein n=1 Tax=Araneus ventricosus TaxID=182803 RepID=A0A4Y2LK53_ARAVE|nr:hypothetical protein AVEN_126560-1 [Araneus ventricosus]